MNELWQVVVSKDASAQATTILAKLAAAGYDGRMGTVAELKQFVKALWKQPGLFSQLLDAELAINWDELDVLLQTLDWAMGNSLENMEQHGGARGALLIRYDGAQRRFTFVCLDGGPGFVDAPGWQHVPIHDMVKPQTSGRLGGGSVEGAGMGLTMAAYYADDLEITEFHQPMDGPTEGSYWRKGEAEEQGLAAEAAPVPHGVKLVFQKTLPQPAAPPEPEATVESTDAASASSHVEGPPTPATGAGVPESPAGAAMATEAIEGAGRSDDETKDDQ